MLLASRDFLFSVESTWTVSFPFYNLHEMDMTMSELNELNALYVHPQKITLTDTAISLIREFWQVMPNRSMNAIVITHMIDISEKVPNSPVKIIAENVLTLGLQELKNIPHDKLTYVGSIPVAFWTRMTPDDTGECQITAEGNILKRVIK